MPTHGQDRGYNVPIILSKIISGGQTGADQGALFAARQHGIATGGSAPKGWATENGPAPWLVEYGLIESLYKEYSRRTRENIRASDGTVIFGKSSVGSNMTSRYARSAGKPTIWLQEPEYNSRTFDGVVRLLGWLEEYGIKTLNVAGNRESVMPGIGRDVKEFMLNLLSHVSTSI